MLNMLALLQDSGIGDIGAGMAVLGAAGVVIGAGIGIGRIGGQMADAMARQPEAAAQIQTGSIILAALIEGAALFGLVFEDWIDGFFYDAVLVIPFILVAGAALLWLAERIGTRTRELDQSDYGDAAFIGVAQALALLPGISRSGITIAAGLARGLDREAAARFAFLMGIPIIAGAGLWKARHIVTGKAGDVDLAVLAAGVIAAFVSGWLAIGFMLRYLRDHSTGIFIAYRRYGRGELPNEEDGYWAAALDGYGVDAVYGAVIVAPGKAVAAWLARVFDPKVIDGAVNGLGSATRSFGSTMRVLQTGWVRSYAAAIVAGALGIVIWLLWQGGAF